MSSIFWTGYSGGDRHHIITSIKETVAGYGDIVDFKLYSDISIVIMVEIQERNIDALYNQLSGFIQLDKHCMVNSNSEKERVVYLNITFAQATGDLKVDVPSVPG